MKTYPQVIAPGVTVIGRYTPDKLDASTIGEDLLRYTVEQQLAQASFGAWNLAEWSNFGLAAEVRSPSANQIAKTGKVASVWHKDNSTLGDPTLGMVLWSNREQTELLLPDGTILNPEPFDILLIHNDSVKHRTPPEMSEDRWFFRRMVKVPDWMQIAK